MANEKIISFLKSFFALFEAVLEQFQMANNKITGSIYWPLENDRQDFSFLINDNTDLEAVTQLCNLLDQRKLLKGDKIVITEEELVTLMTVLGWEKNIAQRDIDLLCDIDIKMVDEGVETDSFFVHF